MKNYQLIVEATKNQSLKAVWELILQFKPLIRKECFDHKMGYIDEDLMSEILSQLPGRILRFRISPKESASYAEEGYIRR